MLMPFSTPVYKEETKQYLINNFDPSSKILDVGPGRGNYSILLREYFKHMDGVEIFEPYINSFGLKNIYENIWVSNIIDFDFEYYDIIIMGDVLEHIEETQGIELVKKLYPKCNELIIAIPYEAHQGEWGGNIYETHLQPHLTHESFLKKYVGFKPLGYRNDYGVYIKDR